MSIYALYLMIFAIGASTLLVHHHEGIYGH